MNKPSFDWRRLLQFRLRSLLLFVLVAAIACAWYTRWRTPPSLGLDGCCPVTLVHNRSWQTGNPRYNAVYEGRLYLFVGPNEKTVFESCPDRYAPISAGADVVRLSDEGCPVNGAREHGVTYNGRIYLFESESTLKTFYAAPDRYAKTANSKSDSPR